MALDYLVTYKNGGHLGQVNADKDMVMEMIDRENAERRQVGTGNVFEYGFKIEDIYGYNHTRDLDFFSPGVSKADKYCDKVHGYFIKDTRTDFKALAPGTNKVLIFDTRQEAQNYFFDHSWDIKYDYQNQRDFRLDEKNVIYQGLVNDKRRDSKLNLTGVGSVFPSDDVYTKKDISRLLNLVNEYDEFHRSHEYAQLLTCNKPEVSRYVMYNATFTEDDNVYVNFDNYDKYFKEYINRFVENYPELVNDSAKRYEDYLTTLDLSNSQSINGSYENSEDLSFE